ncbi:hypothetical protein SVAN01_05223 [Stagonosporopsis vannaccii]|nr:hypothetical protein SVAN01_05223 [Stagonosporopsis vannaccii]
MPQTLYRFGIDSSNPAAKASTPIPIITDAGIKILWSSWCDLIYVTAIHESVGTINYLGTGLNAVQQLDLQSSSKDAGSSGTRQSILTSGAPLRFFGTAMHDGVRGYIAGRKVTLYGIPAEKAEKEDAYRDVDSWDIPHPASHPLAEVSMCSDDSLLVVCRPNLEPKPDCKESAFETIVSLGDGVHRSSENAETERSRAATVDPVRCLESLKEYCKAEMPVESVAHFAPTQLVVNATTATALDADGKVYTRTTDPRYPACLGRPYTGTSTFEPVPYLSETRIVKLASGGYMTAAISDDGELFLWGQANPGTEGELDVLHKIDYDLDTENLKGTVIWCDAEQDNNVKCLNICINGRDAFACDVAVGFGHILVAAKNDSGQHVMFAAGCGDEGQLGLCKISIFMKAFEEVMVFRGKRIMQLAAAGWSSFVVVDE